MKYYIVQLAAFGPEKFVRNSVAITGWDLLLCLKPVILAAKQKCLSCLFACTAAILFSECLCFSS